jgi:hypothetical protein
VRLAPQTILTFVFFEQIRFNLGYIPPPPSGAPYLEVVEEDPHPETGHAEHHGGH